jgi:hypothetical protein
MSLFWALVCKDTSGAGAGFLIFLLIAILIAAVRFLLEYFE